MPSEKFKTSAVGPAYSRGNAPGHLRSGHRTTTEDTMGQAPPTSIQQTWRDHEKPFTAVITQVRDWDAPSPCEGWAARDVLAHVIDTERDFLRDHGHPLPDGAPAGSSGSAVDQEPSQRWLAHAAAVDALLADDLIADERFDGFFGPTTIGDTWARFYCFDLLVHRWDIGTSQGLRVDLSDEELAAIDDAVDGFGEHAYMPGIFGPPVEVGTDASRQVQVLARTGRHATS